MNIELSTRWTAMLIHDGVNLHEMVSYSFGRHSFSALLIDSQDLGVSYSVAF